MSTHQSISGSVSYDGEKLPGVTVSAKGSNTEATRTAITDREGNYHINNIPADQYKVTATIEGFLPQTHEIGVFIDRQEQLDFYLVPSQNG